MYMKEEIWSINYEEALNFVKSLDTDFIKVLRYESNKISNMVFERVKVIFDGPDESELRKKFMLRFMKGGG